MLTKLEQTTIAYKKELRSIYGYQRHLLALQPILRHLQSKSRLHRLKDGYIYSANPFRNVMVVCTFVKINFDQSEKRFYFTILMHFP